MPPIEINTPVAFIKGHVEVANNIPSSSTDAVFVYADQNGANGTQTNFGAVAASQEHEGHEYSLTVAPGTWQVWAKLGPVTSAKHPITVAAGDAVEVDFAFGADPD
jgi:hypothetical protein